MEPRRLWNDDTLDEIFRHLTPSSFPHPYSRRDCASLQALSRCARSSKTLHEPASRALWRELDSLLPLLHLLSPTEQRVGLKTTYALDREVSIAAKDRFRFYATFVRTLSHDAESPRRRVAPSVLAELTRQFPGERLLPGLRALHCSQSKSSNALDFLVLVAPSLRSLSIAHISDRPSRPAEDFVPRYVFGDFMRQLTTATPSLQTLNLSGSIHPSSVFPVSELTQLQKLKIVNTAPCGAGSGSAHILSSCAALDQLVHFGINLTAEGRAPPQPCAGFRRLRDLTVHGTLALVSHFLLGVSSPQLASFSAFIGRPDSIDDYAACTRTLAARFGGSLRTVHLSGSWTGAVGALARPMAILSPLLALRHLEELQVVSGTGVALSLSAEDVHAIAKAWPALRDFRFVYQALPATLPITALVAFATHCPALRTLWLSSVDFRGAAALPVDEDMRAKGHELSEIMLVGDVSAGNEDAIARHLDGVFPRADTRPMACEWQPSWHYSEGWEAVLARVQEIRAAKR